MPGTAHKLKNKFYKQFVYNTRINTIKIVYTNIFLYIYLYKMRLQTENIAYSGSLCTTLLIYLFIFFFYTNKNKIIFSLKLIIQNEKNTWRKNVFFNY